MAITFEANYSKKLGLPGFSSHQYSVTVKTELTDIKQVELESARLYALLQSCAGWAAGSMKRPAARRPWNNGSCMAARSGCC